MNRLYLTTTSWGQGNTYNMYCPSASSCDCGIAAAGCGSVAVAQIFNVYHKPLTYTIAPAAAVSYVYPLATTRSSTACTSTNVRDKEIAALIRNAGMWVDMHYDFYQCSSFNWREDTKNAFSSAGYSNAGNRVSWNSNYDAVNNEIKGGHPVIMDGTTGFINFNNWHIWVIDGYRNYISYRKADEQNPMSACLGSEYAYYHMNWGWNGVDNNAWYGFGDFWGDGHHYDYDLNITLGIRP